MIGIGKGGELNVVLRVKDNGSVTVEKFGRTAEKQLGKGARAARAMSAAYEHATGNLSALSRNVFSLKGALAGLGLGAVSKQFIDAASTSEQFRVRLSVLLGDVDEGSRLFDEMAKYASRVPFEYQDIMASATQLSGILKGGVNEITQWIPLIGDLAAASGLGIQQTTEQVSRMLSAGANSADLFRERGILAMLGFQAGVQVSAEETKRRLIEAWTDTNSQFRGATEQLSRTWDGTMSMLSDKWFLFRNQVMDAGLFDYLKAAARVVDEQLGGALAGNEEAAKRWADGIINAIETMALGTAKFVDVVDGPISRIASVGSDLWSEYQRLPEWAQEVGIVGALLGGKKGLIVIAGLTAVGDEFRTTAEWWKAYSNDEIGFFEWLTTGNEEAEKRLEQIRRNIEMRTGQVIRDMPTITDGLLGEDGEESGSATDRVRTFFEQVRQEMENARREMAAATAENTDSGGGGGFILGQSEQEVEKLRLALSEKLAILDESFLNERDLLQQDYIDKQFLLEEALELEAQSYEAYYQRRAALDAWYSNAKGKLEQKDLKRTEAVENSARAIRQATFNHGVQLLNALAVHSKAAALIALALQKALAIAETIVNTKVAQMRALAELGPIAGPPMAAAIGAWGAASVALIAATGLVQAAGIIGGNAPQAAPVYEADPGTSTPVSDAVGSTQDEEEAASERREPRVVNIVIDSDRMLTSNLVRDELIPQINEAVGDGVVLRVSS